MDFLSPEILLKTALCVYAAAAFLSLAAARRERTAILLGFGGAMLGGFAGLAAALAVLTGSAGAQPPALKLWDSPVPGLQLTFMMDPLGALFVLIVSVLAVALSIYSLGYVRGWCGRKPVGTLAAFYNALLLATTLVFVACNAFWWRGNSWR